jgi:hypothetical protein
MLRCNEGACAGQLCTSRPHSRAIRVALCKQQHVHALVTLHVYLPAPAGTSVVITPGQEAVTASPRSASALTSILQMHTDTALTKQQARGRLWKANHKQQTAS